jgi:hypothetical protein
MKRKTNVKKLNFNKETMSLLSNFQQTRILGGTAASAVLTCNPEACNLVQLTSLCKTSIPHR